VFALAKLLCSKKCEELNNVPAMDRATAAAIDHTP